MKRVWLLFINQAKIQSKTQPIEEQETFDQSKQKQNQLLQNLNEIYIQTWPKMKNLL